MEAMFKDDCDSSRLFANEFTPTKDKDWPKSDANITALNLTISKCGRKLR
jgi:hypothetical protein